MDIQQILYDFFGFGHFLPGRKNGLDLLVGGNAPLAIFLTGQGRSLCYQLTALHLPGLTFDPITLPRRLKECRRYPPEKNAF